MPVADSYKLFETHITATNTKLQSKSKNLEKEYNTARVPMQAYLKFTVTAV